MGAALRTRMTKVSSGVPRMAWKEMAASWIRRKVKSDRKGRRKDGTHQGGAGERC